MERLILNELLKWKNSKYRKPLILKGVRQVGKTWVLKEFGKRYYDNVAYFNFDENEEYKQFFETTKDVERILQNLMLASGQRILPEKTLIIFDEVQDSPKVINSMKYFRENAPQYHIACAGSLLGIALAKPSSFPVGKVNFMQIDPMTFTEFLMANGDGNLAEYLNTVDSIEPIPDAFYNPLTEKLKMYYVTGGMPEPVLMWTQERDVAAMQEALSGIIGAYERDFAKHPDIKEFPKISLVWKSVPSQLARENKKFIYKVVKEGARAREYEDALQWLVDARLVHKVYRSTAPRLPVSAYDDLSAFKIYLVDVGLLRRLAQLAPTAFGEGNRLFTEFKGALTENYVLQTLVTQFEVLPRYWSQNNPPYEVDFLIQRENDIFPVEVKSETNIASKSLRKFKELFPEEVKLRIRFSLDNLKLDGDVLNIPLFMADQTDKLIGMAMKRRGSSGVYFESPAEDITDSSGRTELAIAHRAEDGREQSILEHAQNVSELCAAFAAPFGAEELGRQLGLAHDIGKYSAAFQRRILGENIQTDHSTAGAQEIFKYLGWPAAYCVAGHHGGLPDGGGKWDSASDPTLSGRLKRPVEPYADFSKEIQLERVRFRPPKILGRGGFTMAFWTRMLYSCLVDADYLDTEAFMQGSPPPRGSDCTMEQLFARLEAYTACWNDPKSELDRVRSDILRACLEAGERQVPGLFTLTVPTGGGKTISSLAFALRHALAHGKKRIIYVIPYTSIIEQTADTFRKALGEEVVLEHHANVDFGDDETGPRDPEKERKKLAAENWDLPVVVTTAVQFFESLFANKPSRCRKLHNLAGSIIIFDEAQTIPLPYLLPCVRAIAELTVNYGATCVLCTATQPALGPLFRSVSPDLTPREIAPKIPSQVFRRVRYEQLGQLSDEALAQRLNAHAQVLCIVSTRKQAQAVYNLLEGEGSFHLSTLMPPESRRAILEDVKERLKAGLPCRVVSTSLIEAGVDVDFPAVYRAEAGLDSLVQAAGRCNREGKRPADDSRVYIFRPDGAYTAALPHSMKRPMEVMRSIARDCPALDAPETIERYFTALRQFTGEAIDSKRIVPRLEDGVQDRYQPSFPFAEVAREFCIIEQNTRAVLIPCTEEAQALAARLRGGERSRALLRKAGQYSVNIYGPHFATLKERGALEVLEEDLAVLTDLSLYSESTGLALKAEEGVGIFI